MNGGSKPWKSVNYIESHDDYAFIDRIFSFSDSEIQSFQEKVIRKNRLALFLILFSPGIPMLSAGQDFMRNKKGHRNTYQNGELNALKYSDLKKYKTLHLEICRMIEFRRSDEVPFCVRRKRRLRVSGTIRFCGKLGCPGSKREDAIKTSSFSG